MLIFRSSWQWTDKLFTNGCCRVLKKKKVRVPHSTQLPEEFRDMDDYVHTPNLIGPRVWAVEREVPLLVSGDFKTDFALNRFHFNFSTRRMILSRLFRMCQKIKDH